MLEKIGNDEIIVRNYTDNFSIKEFIQEELIPKAFPNIPMNKLNVGFTGIVSEYISQGIEDAHGTASLMMNEAFITKAVLPNSIYSNASLFGLGYTFATPSKASFALQLQLSSVIEKSTPVSNTNTMRYVLDKDTKLVLGDNVYKPDYDIYIDHTFINGKRVFSIYYNIEETNSISDITNPFIKHQVSTIDWLILLVDLKEFDRKVDEESITDNLITSNSEIELMWTRQIAGLDLVYISPKGQRQTIKLQTQYTKPSTEPFCWYRFIDDNTISLSFNSNNGYWVPEFNSRIEYTIYTTNGKSSNFTSYDSKNAVAVEKNAERYGYNADTKMVAICYSGSHGGLDKGTIENLRDDVILAYNTSNVLTTERDMQLWFDTYGKKCGTRAEFFKRRDDPTGRLFSQFIAITDNTYVYPTNTLDIEVDHNQFDFINDENEFIIKPGHLWEYASEGSRNLLRMVTNGGELAMITDEVLPSVDSKRPYMFVNPFFIKISRNPMTSMEYNYLLDYTTWPESEPIQSETFYQFQLAQFSIKRSLSSKKSNMYHIEVICVPIVTSDTSLKYVEGIGDDYPVANNNLRLVLITRTAKHGETGYIEMTPSELRNGGSILFETDIVVYDNIRTDMTLEIDMDKTDEIHSLIIDGANAGKVFIDSQECSFHFACLMKDASNKSTKRLFEDPKYDGYVMANRFRNPHRDLTLYKALSMMRNTITFSGMKGDYKVTASMIPMLRYDIPLDTEKMAYFVQAFAEQYKAMEPMLSKLEGESFLDFKLYNTYGRSNNYYIGPEDGKSYLKDSDILLDNVYVKVKLVISVYDRSLYTQTVEDVTNEIIKTFERLSNDNSDLHVSDLIHNIITNNPNVRYLRFLGFNEYDANKQSIFVKYSDVSELAQDALKTHIPEIIRVDENSIEIVEEV